MHTLKVHRTDTCVCHPTPPLKQLAAVSIYHRSPDRAQIPMQFLCTGRRELMFFEHLLCATQHTEPFTCAFFLKLFISPLKFILRIVNMRPREMTPITQRVGCPPGMVPLDPAVPPLPHPWLIHWAGHCETMESVGAEVPARAGLSQRALQQCISGCGFRRTFNESKQQWHQNKSG